MAADTIAADSGYPVLPPRPRRRTNWRDLLEGARAAGRSPAQPEGAESASPVLAEQRPPAHPLAQLGESLRGAQGKDVGAHRVAERSSPKQEKQSGYDCVDDMSPQRDWLSSKTPLPIRYLDPDEKSQGATCGASDDLPGVEALRSIGREMLKVMRCQEEAVRFGRMAQADVLQSTELKAPRPRRYRSGAARKLAEQPNVKSGEAAIPPMHLLNQELCAWAADHHAKGHGRVCGWAAGRHSHAALAKKHRLAAHRAREIGQRLMMESCDLQEAEALLREACALHPKSKVFQLQPEPVLFSSSSLEPESEESMQLSSTAAEEEPVRNKDHDLWHMDPEVSPSQAATLDRDVFDELVDGEWTLL
eukprot:gnl/TRDRNA2_/TRDRNA2_202564_c0_seq1.p1 gnl/TRDRNA2_/TRDRNA2_202564_c0~~gnl/TRDRNA2_/TRDRNA2_202564_c0_seq1.p1  ORF type:complete len:378 (-),score=64.56 gnl/TRDRNA2_/TRDRNA2_202564_c0_seq1:45-1130(-)